MPVVQQFTSSAGYLAGLSTDGLRWVAPRSGTYDNLRDANLLPRGL
jgi:hypothetical protein